VKAVSKIEENVHLIKDSESILDIPEKHGHSNKIRLPVTSFL
jgi:hypothetical protein